MVGKNRFYLVVLVVLVVFSISLVLGLKDLAGDIPKEVSCTKDSDCKAVCNNATFLATYSTSKPPPEPKDTDCMCHTKEKFCYDTGLPPSWVSGVNITQNNTSNQNINKSSANNLNQQIDTNY